MPLCPGQGGAWPEEPELLGQEDRTGRAWTLPCQVVDQGLTVRGGGLRRAVPPAGNRAGELKIFCSSWEDRRSLGGSCRWHAGHWLRTALPCRGHRQAQGRGVLECPHLVPHSLGPSRLLTISPPPCEGPAGQVETREPSGSPEGPAASVSQAVGPPQRPPPRVDVLQGQQGRACGQRDQAAWVRQVSEGFPVRAESWGHWPVMGPVRGSRQPGLATQDPLGGAGSRQGLCPGEPISGWAWLSLRLPSDTCCPPVATYGHPGLELTHNHLHAALGSRVASLSTRAAQQAWGPH